MKIDSRLKFINTTKKKIYWKLISTGVVSSKADLIVENFIPTTSFISDAYLSKGQVIYLSEKDLPTLEILDSLLILWDFLETSYPVNKKGLENNNTSIKYVITFSELHFFKYKGFKKYGSSNIPGGVLKNFKKIYLL